MNRVEFKENSLEGNYDTVDHDEGKECSSDNDSMLSEEDLTSIVSAFVIKHPQPLGQIINDGEKEKAMTSEMRDEYDDDDEEMTDLWYDELKSFPLILKKSPPVFIIEKTHDFTFNPVQQLSTI